MKSIIGSRLDKWEIVRVLGEGGQAITFITIDVEDAEKKEYVMKFFIHREDLNQDMKRFKKEIKALEMSSGHENIVKIIDSHFGSPEIDLYYVMEKCDKDLEQLIKKRSRSDYLIKIFDYYSEILTAVKFLHSKNIIHRDLKPANILIKENKIKVGDFGICYIPGTDRDTFTNEQVGPKFYIAPEFLRKRAEEITFQADYYSLGKILYYLLSDGVHLYGEYFDKPNFSLAKKLLNVKYDLFNKFFSKTISFDIEGRYETIDELIKGFQICKNNFLNPDPISDYSIHQPEIKESEKEYIETVSEENKADFVQKLFVLLIQFIEQYFSDQPRLNIEQIKNFRRYFIFLGLVIRGSNSVEFLQGKYIFRPVSGYNPLIPLTQSFPPLRSRSFDIHSTYDVYPYATFESRIDLYFEIIHWVKDEFSLDLYPPEDILPNDIEYVKNILNNLISAIKANDPKQLSKDLNISKKKYLLLHYTNCKEILDSSIKHFKNLNEIQLGTYYLGYDTNEIRIFNNKHPQQDWKDLVKAQKNQYKNELLLLFSKETTNLDEYWINPEKKKKILQEFISALEKDDWKTIYNITQNPSLKKFIIQFPEINLWKWEYVNNSLIIKEGEFILSSFKDGIVLEKKENDEIIKYKSTYYTKKNIQIKDDYIQTLKKLLG
jgi:serine/threonine protein kinase